MKIDEDPYSRLRVMLQEISWPAVYIYKFIGIEQDINRIKYLFKSGEVSLKQSNKKKYVSLTARMMMLNPDDVINVYKDAAKVKGVIAL